MHVHGYSFDSAVPTRLDLDITRLQERRHLPGFELDETAFGALAKEFKAYAGELLEVPLHPMDGCEFWFRNGGYEDADALTLYCMIRDFKPRRLIEVGCGFSSRVISMAARRNESEGHPVDCLFIEPYPPAHLRIDRLAGKFLRKKVEEVPLEVFRSLERGDFLFIDTSHVMKVQNDCCYEYLEIIPSLAAGVLVHIHDIFTPYDYPADWITENQFAFNEQYALECLLTGNPSLKVVLPVFLLWKENRALLDELLPGNQPLQRPGAFWFQTGEAVAARSKLRHVIATAHDQAATQLSAPALSTQLSP